jgi:hypothetical protein
VAPPPAATAVVAALPGPALKRFRPHLRRLLNLPASGPTSPGAWRESLVRALLAAGTRDAAELLGDTLDNLVQSGGERLLGDVYLALVKHGLGARYLVELARSRKAPQRARLLSLRAIAGAGDPTLVAAAVRFRVGELLDDGEVRAEMARQRTRLQEEARRQKGGDTR